MSLNFAVCSGTQIYRCVLQQVLKFMQHLILYLASIIVTK
jgi:hypothetical protein